MTPVASYTQGKAEKGCRTLGVAPFPIRGLGPEGERWYRSALCWPHFWTIWTVQALHTPQYPWKIGSRFVPARPRHQPATVGTAPAAIRPNLQAARSPVSAGSQPQRSQHDGETGTETIVKSAFGSVCRVGEWESTGISLRLSQCYCGDVAGTPRGFLDIFPIPWEEKSIPCCFAPRGKKSRGVVKGAEEEHTLSL